MSDICIIIPVYNAEKYIGDCINSLLCQSYNSFKLILVNDGSKDASLDICKQFAKHDDRIVVLSQENKGAAAARNKGIEWAISEGHASYLGFVDSDDWVHPDYLLRLYEGVKSSGCKISLCNSVRSDTRDYKFASIDPESELVSPEKIWCRNRNLCVVPWGKIYATELFESIRFPEDAKAAEDEFVSYQVMFSCNQICYIDSQLYCYFQSENSIMRSEWTPKRMAGIAALEQQLNYFYLNGYRDALHESANTYLYLLDNYIKSIESMDNNSMYKDYRKNLKKKLQNGVHEYFTKYRFPKKGNEWVYALTHPVTGKVLLKINNKRMKKKNAK